MPENNDNNNGPTNDDKKYKLAINVTNASIGLVTAISVLLIILSFFRDCEKGFETARNTFNTILPVVGTWIGTILAYYFAKENFESANKSVRDIVKQMTPTEKLQSIPVKDKMILKEKMFFETIDDDNISKTPISSLIDKLTGKGLNRLPVLFADGRPRFMIHRSILDKYLSEKALQGMSAADLKAITLKALIDDNAEMREMFEKGFGVVKESATLADAKLEMDKRSERLDVFITKNGTYAEPVIGWITNLIINDNAVV